MLPFDLRPADIDTVNIQRKNHSCPTVRDRLWVLWMVHLGFARQDAAAAVGCSNNSVTNYVRMYQDGGLEAVMTTAYQRNDHPLADRFDEVRQGLVDACIHTLGEAHSWLAEQYDYLVSRESVRKLLDRLGLKRRKVNHFSGKPKDIGAWMEAQRC